MRTLTEAAGRRQHGDQAAGAARARPAGGQDAGLRIPRARGQPSGRGAHPAARQLVDERRARPADDVVGAGDAELAPHLGHAPGAEVADLVRVAARLAPGPQVGREAEGVLQRLVGEEVAVALGAGALGVGPPLAGQDGHAAEPGRLLAGLGERVGGDRAAVEAARVQVRRVDGVGPVREGRQRVAADRGEHDRGLEEHEVAVTVPGLLAGADRRDRALVHRHEPGLVGRAERVGLVHEVEARDRVRAGEAARDVTEHPHVAGLDAGAVEEERLPRLPRRGVDLALAGEAPRQAVVQGGPGRGAVPADRRRRPAAGTPRSDGPGAPAPRRPGAGRRWCRSRRAPAGGPWPRPGRGRPSSRRRGAARPATSSAAAARCSSRCAPSGRGPWRRAGRSS